MLLLLFDDDVAYEASGFTFSLWFGLCQKTHPKKRVRPNGSVCIVHRLIRSQGWSSSSERNRSSARAMVCVCAEEHTPSERERKRESEWPANLRGRGKADIKLKIS